MHPLYMEIVSLDIYDIGCVKHLAGTMILFEFVLVLQARPPAESGRLIRLPQSGVESIDSQQQCVIDSVASRGVSGAWSTLLSSCGVDKRHHGVQHASCTQLQVRTTAVADAVWKAYLRRLLGHISTTDTCNM